MANETDQTFLIGQSWDSLIRDRYAYDRDKLNDEAIRAWRLNPLARQITNLYKIYTMDGISFDIDDPYTKAFLNDFWTHELNDMPEQLEMISTELYLTGNLFNSFSIDSTGMTYYRVYPTDQIDTINTAPNDVMREESYTTKHISLDVIAKTYENPYGKTSLKSFMTHEAINRLAGACWGEGEIWPDLPWLSRYTTWLEDRTRLNHGRTAYMYIVQGQYKTPEEKKSRQRELNANPPRSGQILVTDPSEQWGTLSPSLDSFDASIDGQTIKKMVMTNNAPMHYAAEPENSTRTTADAAGTPTFKSFKLRQTKYKTIIQRILETARKNRAFKDDRIDLKKPINITSADATERDNAALALAITQIVQSIGEMYDRELIDEAEFMRLVYRFGGETLPANYTAPKGKRRTINKPAIAGGISTDSKSGNTTIKGGTYAKSKKQ